jgi:hypothetical protein
MTYYSTCHGLLDVACIVYIRHTMCIDRVFVMSHGSVRQGYHWPFAFPPTFRHHQNLCNGFCVGCSSHSFDPVSTVLLFSGKVLLSKR